MAGIDRRQLDRSRRCAPMKFPRSLLVLAAALFTAPVLGSVPAAAAVIIPTTQDITIEVNHGHPVRLNEAASVVFVANSAIAEVAVKSPRLIFVFAKKPGVTTLYAVDENENVVASIRLVITHNLAELQKALNSVVSQTSDLD
jgi:pilus assembly protein CpaC